MVKKFRVQYGIRNVLFSIYLSKLDSPVGFCSSKDVSITAARHFLGDFLFSSLKTQMYLNQVNIKQ
jgi:hypothetical protein